jgi:lysophospholipase L1-like esterase
VKFVNGEFVMQPRFFNFAFALATVWMTISSASAEMTAFKANDSRIAVMGRVEQRSNGNVRFSYPGVTLHVNFVGSRLAMEAVSTGEQSYLEVSVDRGTPEIIRLAPDAASYLLVNDTESKQHHVEILHRSETWHGVVTVNQFHVDGTLLPVEKLPTRKMLVLGDSVSCGEAIDRVSNEKKNPAWWNPRLSYGMLLASELNAQVQLVCMGGHGLMRTWDGKLDQLNLMDFYQLAVAERKSLRWDHSLYQADLIISAIGTNDFALGIPPRRYAESYAVFLSILLVNHPRAQIVVTEGAILNGEKKQVLSEYIDEAIKRVNSTRVHHVVSKHYPGDAIDAHPTRDQHAVMAKDLLPQVQALLK